MDECRNRLSDKYKDIPLCDMTPVERDEYLQSIARRGAVEALKELGLNDDYAVADIRDLRDILRAARAIRKTAYITALATAGRIIGWAFILFLAGFFLHTSPTIKKAVVDLMAP